MTAGGRRAALVASAGALSPVAPLELEPFDAADCDGLRVLTWIEMPDGGALPVGDSGRFDWVARLNGNRKLRVVASSIGLLCWARSSAAEAAEGPAQAYSQTASGRSSRLMLASSIAICQRGTALSGQKRSTAQPLT